MQPRIAIALLTGASTLALSSMAYAQAAAPANEVVVTGSRVIANGNNSPTPVTVLSTQQMLEVQPTTVADALNDLPSFTGSQTQTSNPGNSSQNSGANNLNLRDIGATRTLILYDGRRVQPTSPTGTVDIDMIPQLLLQRVDVVTGGASAVYGSDAVSGVVNFITDTKFNGLKVNVQGGISQYGDDKTFDGAIAFGRSFLGGKLHFEASYEDYDDPGIFTKLNRPWGQQVWTLQGAGTKSNPYHLVTNTRLASTSFNGVFTSGPLNGLEFQQNGVASPFVHGTPTGSTNVESGGDGGYYSTASAKTLYQSHQIFSRADYDFTDNIHGFMEFFGTLNHNENNHQLNEVRGTSNFGVFGNNYAYLNNAVLPNGYTNPYSAACAPAGTTGANSCGTFAFGKMMLQAPTLQPETFETQYSFVTGLDGSFDGYKWDVGFEHSNSVQDTRNNANINAGHLLAAENAVVGPNGSIVCNAALVNPHYANCVPLNLFGPTSESQAAIKYITQVTEYWAHTHMDDATGSISGAPVSTWAGPVTMAVSAEWRNLTYNLVSDAQPTDHPDCYGIQFNCTANTGAWVSNTVANRSPVSQSVWEVAYETDIPLIKDVPFIQAFNINGAVRYTDYSNSGGVDTWKIGGDWHINDELTIRATRSRDIRAPNLNELYAPPAVNPSGFTDLHTTNLLPGQSAPSQVNVVTLANPNLVPEEADTTTAGFVWRPHFIPRFSFSVDAYRITLNNAIVSISGNSAATQSVCEQSNGTSFYCSLYVRPNPFSDRTIANYPSQVLAEPFNIASIDTYGADFEANYAMTLFDHPATFRGLLSYQPHLIYNQGPAGIFDMGDSATGTGNPSPSLKLTVVGKYNFTDNFSTTIMERWRNGLRWYDSSTTPQYFSSPPIPSTQYTDVTFSYMLKNSVGNTELFLNIQNLFNQQPVPAANTGGSTTVPGLFGGYLIGDDNIGRYFTLGLKFRH